MTWRVTDRSTLVGLRREGRRARLGPVTAWYVPGDPPPRFAWAVSRKVGGAVLRNRVRRRLREIVEHLARENRVAPGAYLVSVAPAAADRSFEELKENVAATLRAVSDGARPTPDAAGSDVPT